MRRARGNGGGADAPADPRDRTRPATGFDFTHDAYQRTRRGRAVMLGVGAAVAVAAVAGMGEAVRTAVLERAATSHAEALEEELGALEQELASYVGMTGAVNEDALVGYVEDTGDAVSEVLGAEVDYARVVEELVQSAPAGVRIINVGFSVDADGAEVSVEAEAAGYGELHQWEQALGGLPFADVGELSFSGGGGEVSASARLEMREAAASDRAAELRRLLDRVDDPTPVGDAGEEDGQ